MNLRLLCLLFCTAFASGPSHAQSVAALDAQREVASARLREAIIGLRDVRAKACAQWGREDCDLTAISNVELLLHDLETKARRARRNATSLAADERFKKIEDAASDARSKVSDLGDLIKP
jgi:hypothetical protein